MDILLCNSTYRFYKQKSNGTMYESACFYAHVSNETFVFCIEMKILLHKIASQKTKKAVSKGWALLKPLAPVKRTNDERELVQERRDYFKKLVKKCKQKPSHEKKKKCTSDLLYQAKGKRLEDKVKLRKKKPAKLKPRNIKISMKNSVRISEMSSDMVRLSISAREEQITQTIYIDLFELPCTGSIDLQTLCTQFVSFLKSSMLQKLTGSFSC